MSNSLISVEQVAARRKPRTGLKQRRVTDAETIRLVAARRKPSTGLKLDER